MTAVRGAKLGERNGSTSSPAARARGEASPSGRSGTWLGLGAGLVGALGLGLYLFAQTRFVDRGVEVLPAPTGRIDYVEVFDRFRFYVDKETVHPSRDLLLGAVLIAIASVALLTVLALSRAGAGSPHVRRFFAFAAAGAAFLSADELFGLHETIGHNLRFLADVPGVLHADDVVVAAYGVAALAFVFVFRDVLTASRRSLAFFAGALPLALLAALSDALRTGLEEPAELAAALTVLIGFVLCALDRIVPVAGSTAPPPPREGASSGRPAPVRRSLERPVARPAPRRRAPAQNT
jgi:hypothetical protein